MRPRRRLRFVGRQAELDLFLSTLLASEPPFAVLHVRGPGERELGMHWRTARRYLATPVPPATVRESTLDQVGCAPAIRVVRPGSGKPGAPTSHSSKVYWRSRITVGSYALLHCHVSGNSHRPGRDRA